jgi:hypothetical protein
VFRGVNGNVVAPGSAAATERCTAADNRLQSAKCSVRSSTGHSDLQLSVRLLPVSLLSVLRLPIFRRAAIRIWIWLWLRGSFTDDRKQTFRKPTLDRQAGRAIRNIQILRRRIQTGKSSHGVRACWAEIIHSAGLSKLRYPHQI